jgi:hypothetical protein
VRSLKATRRQQQQLRRKLTFCAVGFFCRCLIITGRIERCEAHDVILVKASFGKDVILSFWAVDARATQRSKKKVGPCWLLVDHHHG